MLIRGDARVLPLADGCVQCCVTSPPYWGLRDYGTAQWLGGDAECRHVGMIERLAPPGTAKQASNRGTRSVRSGDCSCGATRIDRQIGLEPTPDLYVQHLVAVFREVWRVLREDGTLWLNLGDCYATGAGAVGACPSGGDQGERWSGRRGGHEGKHGYAGSIGPMTQPNRLPIQGLKPKDLVGIPWRVAFALQADGWYLRSDLIWHKPNPMPESVTDRPTKAHEYLFLLAKSERYYYDADAIAERGTIREVFGNSRRPEKAINPDRRDSDRRVMDIQEMRNRRSVWTIATMPYAGAHFATMPEALIEPCILAGCPLGGLVLDPFIGSGTVGAVAERLGRRWIGIDLSYQDLARERTAQRGLRWHAG